MKPRFPTKLDDPNKVGDFVQRHARETFAMLNNGLTLGDNLACAVIDVDLAHNTETLVANPLRGGGVPLGIHPIAVVENVPSNALSFNATPLPRVAWWRSQVDGLLRLRAFYGTEEAVEVDASTAQSINHGTVTTLTFDAAAAYTRGSVITYNGTDALTATIAGRYAITGRCGFVGAGTSYTRAVSISINGTSTFQTEAGKGQATGNSWALDIYGEASLSANDVVRLRAYQEDPGTAARLTYSSASPNLMSRFRMRLLEPTSAFSRTVRCLVFAA